MKCPICAAHLPLNSDRCPDCGYRLRVSYTAPRSQNTAPYYTPPNPTKRSRGCGCALLTVIPVIALIVAMFIGAANFIIEEVETQIGGFDAFEDFPFLQEEPVSPPDEADENCFAIRDGILSFRPERWSGEPVLRVPETVDGQTVAALAPGCFRGCEDLTTILLPDTVTDIGKEAFAGCTGLRGLYLPAGTESIGPRAFSGCISMESIYIPAAVTEVASGCFDDCASLLYLFYEGEFEAWNAIYPDFINPFTTAICLDGNYYQGAGG